MIARIYIWLDHGWNEDFVVNFWNSPDLKCTVSSDADPNHSVI